MLILSSVNSSWNFSRYAAVAGRRAISSCRRRPACTLAGCCLTTLRTKTDSRKRQLINNSCMNRDTDCGRDNDNGSVTTGIIVRRVVVGSWMLSLKKRRHFFGRGSRTDSLKACQARVSRELIRGILICELACMGASRYDVRIGWGRGVIEKRM